MKDDKYLSVTNAMGATISMLKAAAIISALGTILVAIIGGMVLSAVPDPNREIINNLPNTTPDVKTPASQALNVMDTASSWQDMASLWKNFGQLFLELGIPAAVVGGLFFGLRR